MVGEGVSKQTGQHIHHNMATQSLAAALSLEGLVLGHVQSNTIVEHGTSGVGYTFCVSLQGWENWSNILVAF